MKHNECLPRAAKVGRLAFICLILLAVGVPLGWTREWAKQVRPGLWRKIEPTTSTMVKRSADLRLAAASGITWNVYYDDPSNKGFYDPSQGAARRAAATAVLSYLDSVLDYSGGEINIRFEPSKNSADSFLAAAGTYFETKTNSFTNGAAYEHLSTGVEPQDAPEDIYCIVDFGYPWYTGSGTTPTTQYDLQTVLLHEFTHGLGLLSLVSESGYSLISYNNPGVYSIWDSMLYNGVGTKLFNTAFKYIGRPADLVGSTGGVFFAGPSATSILGGQPQLYTPNPFDQGSSMSHFDMNIAPAVVMEPMIAKGVTKRKYADFEIGTLKDLGYKIKSADTTPPTVEFQNSSMTGGEAATSPSIKVALSKASTSAVKVALKALDSSTAKAINDFNLNATTITFNAGETVKSVPLTVVNDQVYEYDALTKTSEKFALELSAPTGADLGDNTTLTYTITDDDTAPAVGFKSGVSVMENAGTAVLTVQLTGNTTQIPVTVKYATSDSKAKAGVDYKAASGTVTINPPGRSKTINFTIYDNQVFDVNNPAKAFKVTLTSPTNATLATTQATVTIKEDEQSAARDWSMYQ